MKTTFKEELTSIFLNFNPPNISIIGGINIEHIVADSIKTIVGGRGSRLAVFLKKSGLYPEVFSFLGQDEFLNMILNYFDYNNIPITWSINPSGNNIDVRILNELKIYSDTKDENLSINPIFLEEFLNKIENIYIKVKKWNINILDYLIYKKKNIFLDLTKKEAIPFLQFENVYCFVQSNKSIKNRSNNEIIFTKNGILFQDNFYKCKKGFYFEEAISSYQTSFIYGVLKNIDLPTVNKLSFKSFEYAYSKGTFNFFY